MLNLILEYALKIAIFLLWLLVVIGIIALIFIYPLPIIAAVLVLAVVN